MVPTTVNNLLYKDPTLTEYEMVREAHKIGFIEGIKAFAWWRDGIQYVGTCGKTLDEMIAKVEKDFGEHKQYWW